MTGQIWIYSEPTGTHSKRQQVTAVQLLYSDLDCLRSASDAPARGFRPVTFWALKIEGGGADSTFPSPPCSITPRYKSYGRSILRILRSFQFGYIWENYGYFQVFEYFFSGILVYHYPPPPPPPRPTLILITQDLSRVVRRFSAQHLWYRIC